MNDFSPYNSRPTSQPASRLHTPRLDSRHHTPAARIQRNLHNFRNLILGFFISLALICCANIEFSTYCSSETGLFCKECPKHAECMKTYIKCLAPYKNYKKGCYKIEYNELDQLANATSKYILSHNEWNFDKIRLFFRNYTKDELRAAITGDGKMQIRGTKVIPVFRFSNWISYLGLLFSIFCIFLYLSTEKQNVRQRRIAFNNKRN